MAMMAWERGQQRWPEKQLTYIGGLHTTAKSVTTGSRQHHACEANAKVGIASGLMTRVEQYRVATL